MALNLTDEETKRIAQIADVEDLDSRILPDIECAIDTVLGARPAQRAYVIVKVIGGVAEHFVISGDVAVDLLDWDNYESCYCDPATNTLDATCRDHTAEEIEYDHGLYVAIEALAKPVGNTIAQEGAVRE